MYPLEKTAIQVATNVIIASITHESGSTVIVKFALSLPAANHVTGGETTRDHDPSAAWVSRTSASTAAVAQQRISGQWATRRRLGSLNSSKRRAYRRDRSTGRTAGDSRAVRTAAASGRARIVSARATGSDTGGLLGGRGGLAAGGGQRRDRLAGRRG